MLPCIQQLLLKTNAECCAARTLNAVARCGCLLGVAVVECVAGAAGCLRGCCGCFYRVAGYGCLSVGCWFLLWDMIHCKDKMLKIWNKYSQKRNIGASIPISTFMYLGANYIFPRWVCLFCWRKYVDCRLILGIYKSLKDTWMWKLGLMPRYSQKRNI